MSVNRGKQFEDVIKTSFEAVEHTVVARLHDQTNGYAGSKNPCDFLIYHKPVFLAIECKSVHGNTLSISSNPKPDKDEKLHGFYGKISDFQWEKLSEMSEVPGVVAGVMCWWVDKDITRFIPIQVLETHRGCEGRKSVRFDEELGILMQGKKKRVFFDYDIQHFFKEVNAWLK